MVSFLVLILLILWLIYRWRRALILLNQWADEKGYIIDNTVHQWFYWGSKRNNIIGLQFVFLVDFYKGDEKITLYVIMGHWLWGLLEKDISIENSIP